MRPASAKKELNRFDYWAFRNAADKPLLKLAYGGLVTVKTSAANEVQIRLAHNMASINNKDRPEVRASQAKRASSSLVYSRISQTNTETGEIEGTPRAREFGRLAKSAIRQSGGVLDNEYQRNVWFITLTLPGNTVQAIETMAKFDKEIKNAFLQNFRKVFYKTRRSVRESLDYLCVSELQERGAIHFHVAVAWTNERFAKVVKRCYRRWWQKIIIKYSEKSGVDLAADTFGKSWALKPDHWLLECEKVKNSVASYLSKYLSKTLSKEQKDSINSPSRWWSISVSLRAKMLAARNQEGCFFDTYAVAQERICEAAKVLIANGFEMREIRSRWCNQFLGYICFPLQGKKYILFEWAKLLCTTPGALEIDVGELGLEEL